MSDRIGVNALTPRERQCLRLVTREFSEKGLALQIGDISPNTVKRHLSSARAKLGVSSSVAAAAILARTEGRQIYGINTADAMPTIEPPTYPSPDDVRLTTPHKVGEAPGGYFVGSNPLGEREARQRNRFSRLARIAIMVGILVGVILVIVAAPAIHDSFQRAANRIEPPKRKEWKSTLGGTQMSNAIQAAAVAIRTDLLTAERSSEQAAVDQARLIASLIEHRIAVDRPISVGAREIDRGYQALGRTLGSIRTLIVMHQGLSEVAKAQDVEAWYGTSETVPNQVGHLKVVGIDA